jgi:Secretion system C-terminal sorting domain/Pregnancy-associated plasma protein-A
MRYFLLLAFSLGSVILLSAQRPFRVYKTQAVQTRMEQQDSVVVAQRKVIESYIKSFAFKGQNDKFVIPVVFHILYKAGTPYPQEKDVMEQLNGLNRDFGVLRTPPKRTEIFSAGGFGQKIANVEIQFCLGQPKTKDKNNKKVEGINFVPVQRAIWDDSDEVKSSTTGGVDPFDSDAYLNIWVVNLPDTICGYAQMPGGPVAKDGIVIDYNYFGQRANTLAHPVYKSGKTLTHLVGSYLGLYELWNEKTPCGDDFVDDTPIHNAPNHGRHISVHWSTCPDNPIEMTMNFMDASDDEGLFMFTEGQKLRMQAVLSKDGPRSGLKDGRTKCQKEKKDKLVEENYTLDNVPSPKSKPNLEQVKIFPNPAREQVSVQLSTPGAGTFNLVIYSDIGQVVEQKQGTYSGSQNFDLDTSRWPSGIYFVHVLLGQSRHLEKLVINKN